VGNNGINFYDFLGLEGLFREDSPTISCLTGRQCTRANPTGRCQPNDFPSGPNIVDQTILGPRSGSYLRQEDWFKQQYPKEVDQWTKEAIRQVNERIICDPETAIVEGIVDYVDNPPQTWLRQVTALGRIVISIRQPIEVTWTGSDITRQYTWSSELIIWDTPGTAPEDGFIYKYFGPGCYDMRIPFGFPIFDCERQVERARFSISGSGDCCEENSYSNLNEHCTN
jgi:hypothetical protein